jgi:hypothetical protein
MAPGGIEIAETIYFGGAEKANVHAALLQQAHDVEHCTALRGATKIRRIAHGVEKFGGGSFAEHAIFKEADGVWSVRTTRHEKGEHRQTHADENEFGIGDFARGGGYHQLAEGVTTRGKIGFGTSHQDCALFIFRRSRWRQGNCSIGFLRMAASPLKPFVTLCGTSTGASAPNASRKIIGRAVNPNVNASANALENWVYVSR